MKPETKERRRQKTKEWRANLPQEERTEMYRRHNLAAYGITETQFREILTSQDSRCAICRTSEPGGKHNQWHVDHDHETKRVRGLLCSMCNTSLGGFRDSVDALQAAINYLIHWRA